ncbi:AMP-dependent synthetase/ligase [Nitriliruptor alkaliphilus]|uniref:AMP-dependent synthetase/ligase n=1 Tax=Nitriliruptor alkaliphilus TaxID=427918 RepID=UPI00069789E7|nr:long-chain fatty acid--CoA ligase [Nitriliruptor alkaliphilus]
MSTIEPVLDPTAPSAFDAATLCEAFQLSARERPDEVALRTPDDRVQITWGEYAERVGRIAAGLAALGVQRGDTVGLMLTNRPEFQLIDTAILHLGATPFSVYTSSAPEQITYLLEDARNRVLIVEERFLGQLPVMPHVEHLVVIDGDEGADLAALEAGGDPTFDLESSWRAVGPDTVATLIYTSGTTGPPKGVEVTHANLLFVIRATDERVGLVRGGRLVSYLPHAHIVDRLVSNYFQFLTGSSVTVVDDPKAVLAALPGCRPTMFTSVPRVWSKVRAALLAGFEAEPPERRVAIEEALEIGLRKARAEQEGRPIDDELGQAWARADEAFFRPLREKLGLDQVGWLVTGAAPMPAAVNEFFAAIGLALSDCWGMSETSGIGTINDPAVPRIGSVGQALPGTEVRLADDGELLLRGQNVMKGYRGDPERTAEAVDADGWLHTGDVAEISDDGYVRIVDRKKELIINSGGKNMSPAQIESVVRNASPLIAQVCCIGDARPYNVALLVLDVDGAAAYAQSEGLEDRSLAAVAAQPGLRATIADAVQRANSQLSRVERIADFAILPEDWPPDGDELTPTMKLKRRAIADKHAAVIERLYAGTDA